jgi:aspartate dehydrogenase
VGDTARQFHALDDFIEWRPSLVVECAGHAAVKDAVPSLLKNGTDVIVLSIGSFADAEVYDAANRAAAEGGGRLIAATGAIGGIDALRSARAAGLDRVTYVGRKPPAAWQGSPAAKEFDLARLSAATTIFEGDAATAAKLYPKNANVTAAVALAGIGFSGTRVTLVADPALSRNVHEIEASGAFGTMRVVLENEALPGNPKSSWLAALNAEYLVRREMSGLEI